MSYLKDYNLQYDPHPSNGIALDRLNLGFYSKDKLFNDKIVSQKKLMKNQTENPSLEKPTIIIYCKEWCDYLRELVNLLREKEWPFTFFDLRFDTQKANELVAEHGNPLILPILDINGAYYEKPSLSKVGETLDLIRWRQQVDRTYYGAKSPGVH